MAARSVEIFATPEEQLSWLREVGSEPDIWCILERRRVNRIQFVPLVELTLDALGNEFSRARAFLGRHQLSDPVWRQTAAGEELDLLRSYAVLFEPSIISKEAMLAGRLAVMGRGDYEEAGIECEAVNRWYKQLTKSLQRALAVQGVQLFVVSPAAPRARFRGSFVISPGAVALAQGGTHLKQFRQSTVGFEVGKQ